MDDSLESAVIRKGSPVDANEIGRIVVQARDEMTPGLVDCSSLDFND
jgi:hypothetical protein